MEPSPKRRKLSSEALPTASETIDTDNRHSLFVRSLPSSVTTEKLISHFSQSYPLKHATVVLDPTTKISRGFGFVTFTDADDARNALAEFHDTTLDGRKIKVEFSAARQREDKKGVNVTGEELRAKREEGKQQQPGKLIVRNLPWSVKSEELGRLFTSFGKVKYAGVPTTKKGQAGFGIVILRGRKNAEKALRAVNGKVVDGRTLAVDWAVDKETWMKVKEDELDEKENGGSESVEQQSDGSDGGVDINGGTDVDDADVAELEDEEEADEDEDLDEDLEGDIEGSDISSLAHTATTNFNTENTTVFIRNLPYDTDDEALAEHFRENFGPIRYARVVYDRNTERPRGTAFVCFRNEDDAKSCVKGCPKPESPTANGFKAAPSILLNTNSDPSGKYTLTGRVLHVTRALPKGEADKRASEGESTRREKLQNDKRRLYLLSEGTVSAGSYLGQTLSKTDLDVRAASLKQRQKLVKTNPNLGFSLTRLSVRNLPRWVDAKMLKALAREAVVGFASDVKAGNRQPISKEEMAREGEAGKKADDDRKEKGKGLVKQAKIVFESELNGSKVGDGKGGRSRGYGFIEYWTHRNALMGLRWLNGHLVKKPKDAKVDDDERGKRLIVEFAIENAQVVQRRDDRERRVKDRRVKEKEVEEAGKKRKREEEKQEKPKDDKSQDEKNKLAARNRIIAQKRQKRRARR